VLDDLLKSGSGSRWGILLLRMVTLEDVSQILMLQYSCRRPCRLKKEIDADGKVRSVEEACLVGFD